MSKADKSLLKIKGIGLKTFSLLQKKGINSVEDILANPPQDYLNLQIKTDKTLKIGKKQTLKVEVGSVSPLYFRSRRASRIYSIL